MTDMITITGVVATEPTNFVTSAAVPITNFRVASNQRRYDRARQEWVDAGTNWYRVSAFRQLALHTLVSLHKGERVVVTGRLKVREWTAGEKNGTAVEIDADSIGHDLTFGTSTFTRAAGASTQQQPDTGVPASATYDQAPSDAERESDIFGGDAAADVEHEDESTGQEHAAAEAAESTLTATPF